MKTLILLLVGALGVLMILGVDAVLALPEHLGLVVPERAAGYVGLGMASLSVIGLVTRLKID